MTPRHHPGEDILLAHAAGKLAGGPALVVAVHMEGCAECRALVGALEVAGGVLLAELPAAAMSSLALERALAAIDRPGPAPLHQPVAPLRMPNDIVLPAALRGSRIGRWRWLAPGMRWSRVEMLEYPGATVVLMRGRADAVLPAHGHRGTEFTQVLSGAILDDGTRYRAGDMFVADDATNHHLRVAPEAECICIAAIEGRMRMNGLIGRIIQPLVGP